MILESEPNDTKAAANAVALMTGDSIRGNSTGNATAAGPASADKFRFTIGALSPGIYRHRMVITSAVAGHTGTLRGLTQSAGVPAIGSDSNVQTSSAATTPARFNQFYGFGEATAEIFYRVTGTASTTADYDATLETQTVIPTSIGSFNAGSITLTTIGLTTADTDFWVYDGAFSPMAGYGNDDNSVAGGGTGVGFQSILTRNYAPGTYYLAMSNFNLANNQASPANDDNLTGAMLDGNFLANGSPTIPLDLTFSISDGTTTTPVSNSKTGVYDVNWFTFTVAVPEPSSLAFGLAGMALLGARRRRQGT